MSPNVHEIRCGRVDVYVDGNVPFTSPKRGLTNGRCRGSSQDLLPYRAHANSYRSFLLFAQDKYEDANYCRALS